MICSNNLLLTRGVSFLVTLACIFGLVANVQAESKSAATERAFAALVSLPQARYADQTWQQPPPEGFEITDDEADLIEWLKAQKKAGADFNAYRHRGTLLHHAIRSGLDKTALWLLRNGADPTKVVDEEQDSWGTVQNKDALAVALIYQRWKVADVLIKLPFVVNQSSEQTAETYWPFITRIMGKSWQESPNDATDVVNYLLAKRFPLPQGRVGECLLEYGLNHMWLNLALALPVTSPLRLGKEQAQAMNPFPRWAYLCYGNFSPPEITTALTSLSKEELERTDKKLTTPLFPYLLNSLITLTDVETLFDLHIRHPFDNPVFTRDIISRLLIAPTYDYSPERYSHEVQLALLQHIPSSDLQRALDNEATLGVWFAWAHRQTEETFAWALQQVSETLLKTQLAKVMSSMVAARPIKADVPVEKHWLSLLKRLPTPVDSSAIPALLNRFPVTAWTELFALGYRIKDDELVTWLANATPDQLRAAWPLLKEQKPILREQGIDQLLEATCGVRNSLGKADLEKMDILVKEGIKVKQALTLKASCVRNTPPEIYQAFLATHIVKSFDPANAHRFVPDTLNCTLVMDETWRRIFASTTHIKNPAFSNPLKIQGIQAIDYPGDKQCALVVSGGHSAFRDGSRFDSFWYGSGDSTFCTGTTMSSVIWRKIDKDLQVSSSIPVDYAIGLFPARDTQTGKRYYLGLGDPGYGGCATATPDKIFAWSKKDGKVFLERLEMENPVNQAIEQQCNMYTIPSCVADEQPKDKDKTTAKPLTWDEYPFHVAFLDQHWPNERKEFLEALMALDKPRLAGIKAKGIFPHWIIAAIDAVNKSDLPLEDKRQRTAWLFRDHQTLAAALKMDYSESSRDIMKAMIAWLPAEDWTTVIASITEHWDKGEADNKLDYLLYLAQDQGKTGLACRFSKALKLKEPCQLVEKNVE